MVFVAQQLETGDAVGPVDRVMQLCRVDRRHQRRAPGPAGRTLCRPLRGHGREVARRRPGTSGSPSSPSAKGPPTAAGRDPWSPSLARPPPFTLLVTRRHAPGPPPDRSSSSRLSTRGSYAPGRRFVRGGRFGSDSDRRWRRRGLRGRTGRGRGAGRERSGRARHQRLRGAVRPPRRSAERMSGRGRADRVRGDRPRERGARRRRG